MIRDRSRFGWGGVVAVLLGGLSAAQAAVPLTTATVTEIKNDVRFQAATAGERSARVADVLQAADVLRTGERSLAELEFNDKTIARLGSQSVFSFQRDSRDFHAGKGTTLVCVPKGGGGGRIVAAAITAAIQGTTVVVQELEVPDPTGKGPARTLNKVIFLEGNGRLYLTRDLAKSPSRAPSVAINAGQMLSQFADDPRLGVVQTINLDLLVQGARILSGFKNKLPSQTLIQSTIKGQRGAMQHGDLQQGGGGGTAGSSPTTTVPPVPNAQAGGTGVAEPPQSQPAPRAAGTPVGGGFILSTAPVPGMISVPLEGGGYVNFPH